jgi:hypothetical protein
MANEAKGPNAVERAETLLRDLKRQAEEAYKAGDQFYFKLMCNLIKLVSPEVTKAVARYHREERARINSLGKEKPGQSSPNPTTRLGD